MKTRLTRQRLLVRFPITFASEPGSRESPPSGLGAAFTTKGLPMNIQITVGHAHRLRNALAAALTREVFPGLVDAAGDSRADRCGDLLSLILHLEDCIEIGPAGDAVPPTDPPSRDTRPGHGMNRGVPGIPGQPSQPGPRA